MSHIINSVDWNSLLRAGLAEDGWQWDWTTLGSVSDPRAPVRAKVVVKAESGCVWAASGLVQALGLVAQDVMVGSAFQAESPFEDGAVLKKGVSVAEFTGSARSVLALERPFLNLAQYACGIATATHRLTAILKRVCPERTPRLSMTRKTLPGYRNLALASVMAGGGHPHRVGLSGGVLIKENHIASAGGVVKAIDGARAIAPHGLKIECEVRDLDELERAIEAGAEGVLLDNFTPALVKTALARIAKIKTHLFVEVSGGVNEKNIADYALPGIDILSCGWITHSVHAVDLSLLVEG